MTVEKKKKNEMTKLDFTFYFFFSFVCYFHLLPFYIYRMYFGFVTECQAVFYSFVCFLFKWACASHKNIIFFFSSSSSSYFFFFFLVRVIMSLTPIHKAVYSFIFFLFSSLLSGGLVVFLVFWILLFVLSSLSLFSFACN